MGNNLLWWTNLGVSARIFKAEKVQTLEFHQHFSFLSFPKTNKNTNNLPSFFCLFSFYFGTSLFTSDDALHVQTKKGYDYFPHFHRCTTTRERTNEWTFLRHAHGLRTPNEAFFHRNPELLGLCRQFGQLILWDLGYFRPIYQHPFWYC